MGMNTAAVQRLYVAYFNRPADPVSLAVYEAMLPTDSVATQAELQVIAETYFSPSAEYTTNFAGKSNSQIVDQLYQNIFGRTAEADGLISWASKLTDGSITVAELALQLSYSAQGTDAAVVDARIEAATTFTNALDTTPEITGYSGNASAAEGKVYLAQISGELPTTAADITAQKDAAEAGVDASVTSAVSAGNSAAGSTFTLTTSAETLTGTAGADVFNSVVAGTQGAAGTTLNAGDAITGGGATDTLNIAQSGDAGGANSIEAVRITGIEQVLVSNFETDAAAGGSSNTVTTVAASLMSGVTTMGLSSSSAEGDTKFSDVQNLVDAEMSTGAGDLEIAYNSSVTSGSADTQNLTVSGVTAGTFTADGIETIAVTTETLKSKLTDITGSALKKITFAGDQNLTVSTALTEKTLDASAMTGDLTITLGAATHTVTGGAGSDVIDAGTTLSSADTLTGGEGTDTLKLSASGTVAVGTAASKGDLYKVTGFETIDIASTNDAATLNLKDSAGVTTVVAAANQKTVTFTGDTANTAAEVIEFTLNGTTYETASVDFTSATAATDAAAAATGLANKIDSIDGFSASAATNVVTITATTGEAVELAITAGSANTFTEVTSAYNDVTFSNVTDQAVDILSGDLVTVTLPDASGTEDVVNVNLKTLAADKAFAHTIGDIDVTEVETVNLSVTGMKAGVAKTVSALSGDAKLTTLNISGDSDLVITDHSSDNSKLATITSTSTGDVTLSDTVGSLAQTITTGTGNDTVVFAGNLTAADVVDLGGNTAESDGTAGVDTVTASGNIGTVVAPAALQLANVEVVAISNTGAAATYIDAAGITGAASISLSAASGTVKITNLDSATKVGLSITTDEFDGTVDLALADETGSADSISLMYAKETDTASTVAVKVASTVETVNIAATTESAGADTFTITSTNLAAGNIVVTGGHSADTLALGTLNKATTNVDASAYSGILSVTTAAAGAVTVSANGAVANTITTGASGDTITLAGKLGTTADTINAGGGTDTLNVTANAATDFTNVSNVETLNITVADGATASFATGADAGLVAATTINVLGGNSLSKFTTAGFDDGATAQTIDASSFNGTAELTLAADALDSTITIKGGSSSSDKVSLVVAGVDNKPASMTGIETLAITSTDGDSASKVDLTNVTGLTKLTTTFVTDSAAEKVEYAKVATGVTLEVTSAETADNLVVGMTDASDADTTLSLTLKGFGTAGDVLDLDAAGVENLNIKNSSSTAGVVDLAGVDGTSDAAVTVTVTGTGATTLNALNTDITTVDASGGGAVTLAAAQRDGDALTVTGGLGDDTIAMENGADVLDGGLGTDKLVVNYTAILGGINVDLTAADQVVNVDGAANSAVQTGFENVDLSSFNGFGAVVIGTSSANTIVGTASTDNISAGKGNDTIEVALTGDGNNDILNGGAGDDTLKLTGAAHDFAVDENLTNIETIELVSSANVDVSEQSEDLAITLVDSAANEIALGAVGKNTLTNFEVNSDTLNFDSIAGVSGNGVATAGNASQVNAVDGAIYVHADGDDGAGADSAATQIADYTDLEDVAAFLTASYTTGSGEKHVFVINDLVGDDVYAYYVAATATTASGIEAAEITLIGVINDIGSTALDVDEIT